MTWHVSVARSSSCRTRSSTTISQSTRRSTNSRRPTSRRRPRPSPPSQPVRHARPSGPTRRSCATTCRPAGSARRPITTCTPDSSARTPPSLLPPSPARRSTRRCLAAPAATLPQPPSRQPPVTASRPAPKSNRKCFIRTHARPEWRRRIFRRRPHSKTSTALATTRPRRRYIRVAILLPVAVISGSTTDTMLTMELTVCARTLAMAITTPQGGRRSLLDFSTPTTAAYSKTSIAATQRRRRHRQPSYRATVRLTVDKCPPPPQSDMDLIYRRVASTTVTS